MNTALELSNSGFVLEFALAVLLGLLFGALYAGMSALKRRLTKRMKPKRAVLPNALMDFAIFIPSTAALWIFNLSYTEGKLRLYVLVGIALGVAAMLKFVDRKRKKMKKTLPF